MPSFDKVCEFVYEHMEGVKVKGHKITARCPLCGDSKRSKRKKRFNLDFFTDKDVKFYCYNCSAGGDYYKLYSLIKGITPTAAYRECESFNAQWEQITHEWNNNVLRKEPENSNGEYFNWILKDCLSEHNYDPGLLNESYINTLKSFRKNRNIPPRIPLYIANTGLFKGRIIIPVFDLNGNIVYFQGRATADWQEPKYLNPTAEKSTLVPNIENLTEPGIVTEGLLDSFTLGNHGTCSLGKEVNDDFLKKVFEKVNSIILAMDNDKAGYEAMIKFMAHSKYNRKVKYFLMPRKYSKIKDLNELQTVQKNINISDFVISNSYPYVQAVALLGMEQWRTYEE